MWGRRFVHGGKKFLEWTLKKRAISKKNQSPNMLYIGYKRFANRKNEPFTEEGEQSSDKTSERENNPFYKIRTIDNENQLETYQVDDEKREDNEEDAHQLDAPFQILCTILPKQTAKALGRDLSGMLERIYIK